VEHGSELGIVVAQEELRALPKGRQLPKLLGQPVGARNCGRRDMEHAPGCQVHDDEDEVAAEPDVASLKEVAAPDASCLVPEEGLPALAPRRSAADSTDVLVDCALGGDQSQLEELAADALGVPETVLRGHAPDERDRLGRQARLCASLAPG